MPVLFGYAILEQVVVFYANRSGIAAGLSSLSAGIFDLGILTFALFLTIRLLLIAFNAVAAYRLARSPQRTLSVVERPSDVVVPLLSTFFILATNFLAYSPLFTNFQLLPSGHGLRLTGLLLALAGAAISLLGILQIGDSFAMFVERRHLVSRGAYRFMRHPIYTGYGVRMLGYWLMTPLSHNLAFTVAGVWLLVYRARLEDLRLAESHGEAYERYREATAVRAPRMAGALLLLVASCALFSTFLVSRLDKSRTQLAFVQVEGPGLPVVFVHGAAGSKEVWRNQLEHLRGNRRAVALDLHRRDFPDEEKGALEASVADIGAVVRTIGIRRFVLVGHSLGCDYVIAYADRHPEQVAGILLVDPSGDYRWLQESDKRLWQSRFEDHSQRMSIWNRLLLKSKPATRELVLTDLEATPERTFRRVGYDLLSYDPASPFERFSGAKLSAFSACEKNDSPLKNRFSPLPRRCMQNVSHWMMLDAPDEFNLILDEFLAGVRR